MYVKKSVHYDNEQMYVQFHLKEQQEQLVMAMVILKVNLTGLYYWGIKIKLNVSLGYNFLFRKNTAFNVHLEEIYLYLHTYVHTYLSMCMEMFA